MTLNKCLNLIVLRHKICIAMVIRIKVYYFKKHWKQYWHIVSTMYALWPSIKTANCYPIIPKYLFNQSSPQSPSTAHPLKVCLLQTCTYSNVICPGQQQQACWETKPLISKAKVYIQIKCTANDTVHFFFNKDFPHADFIIMLIPSLFLH